MKSIIKLMVVFVCVVSLVACGRKDTTVSANKDGVLYEAGVGVSFYYPSDFKLSEGNPNDGVTRFTKENQILFYKVEENEYDNDTDQLSELYKGELEASGVSSCSKVTVLEFMDELKADQVLQEKAKSLPNVEVFLHSQSLEVVGDGDKVTGLRVKDRKTDAERVIDLDGIFVQIGLAANSGVFRDVVETNKPGEIVIDAHCRTNVPGIYAAGDVSTVPYKQIIIAMGEGAKAALSAFEDRMRGLIG